VDGTVFIGRTIKFLRDPSDFSTSVHPPILLRRNGEIAKFVISFWFVVDYADFHPDAASNTDRNVGVLTLCLLQSPGVPLDCLLST
jgi:hypothetical protein